MKITVLALGVLLCALCYSASAQQTRKVPRIGYLPGAAPSADSARYEAFRQGLRELGYVEGKNIVIENRNTEGKFDRISELAAELVRLKVDVIVTTGSNTTGAAKKATTTIPFSWRRIAIRLLTGTSPALRGQAGTLLDCPRFRRS